MKIIIDPSLIWFEEKSETNENFEYLYSVIGFIDDYLNAKIIYSNESIELLKILNRDPFSMYSQTRQRKNEIIRKIWQQLDDNNIELDNSEVQLNHIKLSSSNRANELFCKKLSYIIKNNIDCLLFLSLDNHTYNETISENIKIVKHIYKEISSSIAELFSHGEYINTKNFLQSTKNNPLPNKRLCEYYSIFRRELIKNGKADIPIYLELGREVVYRNGYEKDEQLTKINNSAIREIFRKNIKNTWYLSTDIEHGAIEVCDEKGKHIDEYTYDGIAQNKHDPTGAHDIKLHK